MPGLSILVKSYYSFRSIISGIGFILLGILLGIFLKSFKIFIILFFSGVLFLIIGVWQLSKAPL